MKKHIIIIFAICSTLLSCGQSISELQRELALCRNPREDGGRIYKARKILELDPLNSRAIEYISRYYYDRKIDSVSIFFDNLIQKNPKNPKPLLLRAKFLHFEYDHTKRGEFNKWKNKYLDSALSLDSTNRKIIYNLAKAYYKDFVFPLDKEMDFGNIYENNGFETASKQAFKHSADSALKYFYKTWEIDNDSKNDIYFPIRQLECYLKKGNSPIKTDIYELDYCYFPYWYFANLGENWECDTSVDYMDIIWHSKHTAESLHEQLEALNEPCLYNLEVGSDVSIFRATWLRTFDNPISIRIEKNSDDIVLYWKVGAGSGGYRPEGLKDSGEKNIKESEWLEFLTLVPQSNSDKLSNKRRPMQLRPTDGATWTLEHKSASGFKAHWTYGYSPGFTKSCKYLLKLSDIVIEERRKRK
ncbi:MAG: hypothetical protein KAH48_03685 [Chlorobi bacterium]|nr:hypothetical protein [Chlorobiota bacterium]